MTDLTTKAAQSLHVEWCRQMREKGSHAPGKCPKALEKLFVKRRIEGEHCNKRNPICPDLDHGLSPWHDLPFYRRDEYLSTAKAVLPEIDQAIAEARLDEHKRCCVRCTRGYGDDGWSRKCSDRVSLEETLRDRCLEELRK